MDPLAPVPFPSYCRLLPNVATANDNTHSSNLDHTAKANQHVIIDVFFLLLSPGRLPRPCSRNKAFAPGVHTINFTFPIGGFADSSSRHINGATVNHGIYSLLYRLYKAFSPPPRNHERAVFLTSFLDSLCGLLFLVTLELLGRFRTTLAATFCWWMCLYYHNISIVTLFLVGHAVCKRWKQ